MGLQPPKKHPEYLKVERSLTPTLQPCCWHNYNAALPCLLVLAHAAGAAHPLLLCACPRSASQRILHTRSARSCCPTHANVHGVRLPHHWARGRRKQCTVISARSALLEKWEGLSERQKCSFPLLFPLHRTCRLKESCAESRDLSDGTLGSAWLTRASARLTTPPQTPYF